MIRFRNVAAVFAAAALVAPAVAEARCWGANGYCTRDRQRARHIEQLAAERDSLSDHKHPTWQAKVAAHTRLKQIEAELESTCRFYSGSRVSYACSDAGITE